MRQVHRGTLGLLILGIFSGLSGTGMAQTVEYRLHTTVQGREKPAIMVRPTEDLKRLEVLLTREDNGKTLTLKTGRIKAGQEKRLTFKHPRGYARYQARFDVLFASGAKENFTTTFDANRCEPLKIQMGAADVDLAAGQVRMRATNQLTEARLVVLGENGRRLRTTEETFDPHNPGEVLELSWEPVKDEILRVEIQAFDICKATYTQRIMPFSIEIPHEEVVFDTGRHEIRPSEAPKLKKTLGHIHKALERHGTLLALKLYIGGCTDTVGSRESNRALSDRRARSIALWLTRSGLPRSLPVYYWGFGEERLKKPTPDEVEEATNRRAIYFLSSQAPPGNPWRSL